MSSSLSLLATYDELVRCSNVFVDKGGCEKEFMEFALNQEDVRQKWKNTVEENHRLRKALEMAHRESADLELKLRTARKLLDEEKGKRRLAEDQRNSLERQIILARELLFNDGGRNLNDETREKLQFLNNTALNALNSNTYMRDANYDKLNAIPELDSTGSILSDLSCVSKSEDDLDISALLQVSKKRELMREHRPSGEYSSKKRRSTLHKVADLNNSDRIVTTTTVVMPKEGAITASSVIEAIPSNENVDPQSSSVRKRRKSGERSKSKSRIFNDIDMDTVPSAPKAEIMTSGSDPEIVFKPSPNIGGYTLRTKTSRGHNFTAKTVIKPEVCTPCGKRIRFRKVALKCKDCRAITHQECKDLLPLPCVPSGNTPTMKGTTGTIADYAPNIPPMVPSIVVHCINEVELRGMTEQGLYRIAGGSAEVKSLKEKFQKGRGAPNLSEVDVATICSTLKDFLRSLREPLITVGLRADFVRAVQMMDKEEADAALYQAISELPQPNRDTLAFLILHLQRVSDTPDCKMPISNLAKIFGPTLVGYSRQDATPLMFDETKDQVAIVESLLTIPSDYWANFVNLETYSAFSTPRTGQMKHTPSTESLTQSLKRTMSSKFFTTPLSSSKSFKRREKNFFATPPYKKY